jgi:uncharacterized protein (TIGR00369 family)
VAIADANGDLVAHGTSRCFIFPPMAPPPQTAPVLEPVTEPTHDRPDPYLRPVAGDTVSQELWDARSGLEVMHGLLSGELRPPPITVLTGLRPTEAAEGRCTFVLPSTEWLNSPTGRMEGGAIAMLAETALIAAVQTTVEPGTSFAPFDLKVNFLRPVKPDGRDLIATGSVTHRGKSLAVASSEITNAEGKSVAVASGTSMILPHRPWRRQAIPTEEDPPSG